MSLIWNQVGKHQPVRQPSTNKGLLTDCHAYVIPKGQRGEVDQSNGDQASVLENKHGRGRNAGKNERLAMEKCTRQPICKSMGPKESDHSVE